MFLKPSCSLNQLERIRRKRVRKTCPGEHRPTEGPGGAICWFCGLPHLHSSLQARRQHLFSASNWKYLALCEVLPFLIQRVAFGLVFVTICCWCKVHSHCYIVVRRIPTTTATVLRTSNNSCCTKRTNPRCPWSRILWSSTTLLAMWTRLRPDFWTTLRSTGHSWRYCILTR